MKRRKRKITKHSSISAMSFPIYRTTQEIEEEKEATRLAIEERARAREAAKSPLWDKPRAKAAAAKPLEKTLYTMVQNGVMYMNGKPHPWRQDEATKKSYVIIEEEETECPIGMETLSIYPYYHHCSQFGGSAPRCALRRCPNYDF